MSDRIEFTEDVGREGFAHLLYKLKGSAFVIQGEEIAISDVDSDGWWVEGHPWSDEDDDYTGEVIRIPLPGYESVTATFL